MYNGFLCPDQLGGAGRRPSAAVTAAAGSVKRTEHRSSGSLRPWASVHYGRTDTFLAPVTGPEYQTA